MQSPIRMESVESFKMPNLTTRVQGDPAGVIEPRHFEDMLSAELQKPAQNDEFAAPPREPERFMEKNITGEPDETLSRGAQAKAGEIRNGRNDGTGNGGVTNEARTSEKSAEKPPLKEDRAPGKFGPALQAGLEKPAPKTAHQADETGKEDGGRVQKEAARSKGQTGDDPGMVIQQVLNMISLLRSLQDPGREAKDLKNALIETRDALIRQKEKLNAGLEEITARIKSLVRKMDSVDQSGNADGILLKNMKLVKDEAGLLADALKMLAKKSGKTAREAGAADPEGADNKKAGQDRTILPHIVSGEDRREVPVSKNNGNSADFSFQFSKNTQGIEKSNSHSTPAQKPLLFDEHLQSIIHNAKITVRDAKNGSFNLRLYPESLGRINVNLGLEQGTLSGRFLVDSLEVKQALMEQISVIREQLQDAGISIGDFQVNVRDGGRSPFRDDETTPPVRAIHEPRTDMSAMYDSNSRRAHDGAIDMII